VFLWMPAASIYFNDPNGHSLEYIAVLLGQAGVRTRCAGRNRQGVDGESPLQ
jgi:hypothetical protein